MSILKHNEGTPSVVASSLLIVCLSGRLMMTFTLVSTSTLPPIHWRILWLQKFSIPSAVTLCMCLDMPAPVSANSMISVSLFVSVTTSVMMVSTRLNEKSCLRLLASAVSMIDGLCVS